MLKRHNNYGRTFYVVQFIDLPFTCIDDYVCVPYNWLVVVPKGTDQKAVVMYPKDEDPFKTRDRVKRKEKCNKEWRLYMAVVKYESDSYEDAEYWIARNNYGPLVEKQLKTTDTEQKLPLNKKLRVANRNRSSKLNDDSRKPLARISNKRPALPEPNKQLDGKRMKLDDAAQSSSAVVTDANVESGFSGQEQSITAQNNQPMESTQTETTASDSHGPSRSSQREDKNLQESLPIQEQQESSMPSIDIDTPTLVIDDNEEVQLTRVKEHQVPSNQAILQFTEQLEPIREPQIPVAPSIEMTSNNKGSSMDDVLNNGPTCHHLLNSLKISAQLYSRVKKARRLTQIQKTLERKMRPVNIARNLSIAKQNPPNLMDQTLSTRSVPTQQQYHTSYRNQYLPTNRNKFEQDLLRKSAESNNYRQRHISRNISMSTPSIGQNSIIPSSPLYQTSELPQQRQSVDHSERALVNEYHLSKIDNTLQIDEWMEKESPSAHHGANSDSDSVTDHEVISEHEMSADEAPIERTNNFYGTGITSGSSCAGRPIVSHNSTNHQTHSKVVLEQQMLDNFATCFTQMVSTLRYISDMDTTLRSSIQDTARIYKELLGAVEQFNSTQNSAGNGSVSINLKPEVRQSPEEIHTEVTANTSSNTQNQHSNDNANKPPKKTHKWRFVLPPEYDPNDTKWTLKYRTNLPGLVELMPQSGVYVSYGNIKYCQQVSKDCKSLARRLLPEVFSRNALSVCLSMTERAQASDNIGSNARPELDDHAYTVLLNFVFEHGLQRGWNTDLQPILSTLHCKTQEIRFKYGVMVQC